MGDVLPHPATGEPFASPVPPGTGWPGDPSAPRTPRGRSAEDVARLAAGSRDLAQLDARVAICRACPRLVRWREDVAEGKRAAYAGQPYWGRPAPGWGDPRPHTLVVGLAPAAHGANRTGRIFTGDRSGDWLYAALFRAGFANQPTSVHAADGLALTGVRITAPVHCAPPDNQPSTSEKATCAPWLDRELALVEPELASILALGGIAWAQTLGAVRRNSWSVPRPLPRFGHGAEATLFTPSGRPVTLVGCYHVSQQNTFTGRLTEAMLDDVMARLGPLAPVPTGGHDGGMTTATWQTLDTPDGPFTVVAGASGAVVASGWAGLDDILARVPAAQRPTEVVEARVAAADAVTAYYAGDLAAPAAVAVAQHGTPLQERAWEELRRIAPGETVSYGALAAAVDRPTASRALAATCAANRCGLFVPCHRVVGADGAITGFAWGVETKRALLDREAAAR